MAPSRWRHRLPFGTDRQKTESPSRASVATDLSKAAEPVADPSPQGLKIVAEGVNPVVE
jgi:hypothetical protein